MTSGQLIFDGSSTQRVSSVNAPFSTAILWGYTGFTDGIPGDNSAVAYFGKSNAQMPIKITAGGTYTLSLPHQDNLRNYFSSGSANDGLLYYAW
jgi:hypothetical protein